MCEWPSILSLRLAVDPGRGEGAVFLAVVSNSLLVGQVFIQFTTREVTAMGAVPRSPKVEARAGRV